MKTMRKLMLLGIIILLVSVSGLSTYAASDTPLNRWIKYTAINATVYDEDQSYITDFTEKESTWSAFVTGATSYIFNPATGKYGVGNPADTKQVGINYYSVSSDGKTLYRTRIVNALGQYIWYNQEHKGSSSRSGKIKDTVVDTNVLANPGTYPDNGVHTDGYWYTLITDKSLSTWDRYTAADVPEWNADTNPENQVTVYRKRIDLVSDRTDPIEYNTYYSRWNSSDMKWFVQRVDGDRITFATKTNGGRQLYKYPATENEAVNGKTYRYVLYYLHTYADGEKSIQVYEIRAQKPKQMGTLVTTGIVDIDGTYPTDGVHTDGYWYVKTGEINTPPMVTVNNINKQVKSNQQISLSGYVQDPDSDPITISATLGGVTKTTTIPLATTAQPWSLTWNSNEIAEGQYTNIVITASDGK